MGITFRDHMTRLHRRTVPPPVPHASTSETRSPSPSAGPSFIPDYYQQPMSATEVLTIEFMQAMSAEYPPEEHSGSEADMGDLSGTRDNGNTTRSQEGAQVLDLDREGSDEVLLQALEIMGPETLNLPEPKRVSPSPVDEIEVEPIDAALFVEGS